MNLDELCTEMAACRECKMRDGCLQVVPPAGNRVDPLLMIVGEASGEAEDDQGEPFVGPAGQVLRTALRNTKILKRSNTLITNVLKCRPPKNKFPKDESAGICVSRWLWKEIELAKPKRMLLLGGVALEYVGGLEGITKCRGNWYNIKGIRTMATYHPSYVMRMDHEGLTQFFQTFQDDINQVAAEVAEIEAKANAGKDQAPIV